MHHLLVRASGGGLGRDLHPNTSWAGTWAGGVTRYWEPSGVELRDMGGVAGVQPRSTNSILTPLAPPPARAHGPGRTLVRARAQGLAQGQGKGTGPHPGPGPGPMDRAGPWAQVQGPGAGPDPGPGVPTVISRRRLAPLFPTFPILCGGIQVNLQRSRFRTDLAICAFVLPPDPFILSAHHIYMKIPQI